MDNLISDIQACSAKLIEHGEVPAALIISPQVYGYMMRRATRFGNSAQRRVALREYRRRMTTWQSCSLRLEIQ